MLRDSSEVSKHLETIEVLHLGRRGIHTVYVFATIKVKRPILLFSLAVKSTAAGSKSFVFFSVLLWLKFLKLQDHQLPPVQQIQQAPPQAANLEVDMFSVFQTGVSFTTWTVNASLVKC